jgi:ketosteroid isomerase-like protein
MPTRSAASVVADEKPSVTPLGTTSPVPVDTHFTDLAMALRERARLESKPQTFMPTAPADVGLPWKTNIVTTVFWIGQRMDNGSSRVTSVWDSNWKANYGGVDTADPNLRRNFVPVSFIPNQNPFYCALPYNDVMNGHLKPEAELVIPWYTRAYTGPNHSVCKDRWIAIRKGDKTAYAQWEDSGPVRTDHFQYVFQNERPEPNRNRGAGLDVSPAVRDYLGLAPLDVTDWQFVEVRDVAPGPWRTYGDNNHFVIAKRQWQEKSAFATPAPSVSPTAEMNSVGVAPIVTPSSTPLNPADAEIRPLEERWAAALVTHDAAVIQTLLADDHTATSPSGVEVNKTTALRRIKNDSDQYESVTIDMMDYRVDGDTVEAMGLLHERGKTKSKKPFDRTFLFTDVWVKRNGKWVCTRSNVRNASNR